MCKILLRSLYVNVGESKISIEAMKGDIKTWYRLDIWLAS